MEENLFKKTIVETPRNSEQRCLCVLCLDVSGSMKGKRIEALNEGLQEFSRAVKKDPVARKRLEIAIVTFDNIIEIRQYPELIDFFDMPTLQAAGTTRLVDGVRTALRIIEERKQYYKKHGLNYYRPFVILMTDGEPDIGQDIHGLAQEIKEGVDQKKFTFWAVGAQGCNYKVLNYICHPHMPPKALDGLKYKEFFQWLSATMTIVSKSSPEKRFLPPPITSWELSDLSAEPTQKPFDETNE
ncbi:vWA domain-containing protein [Thermonema rossianum]|uniref:vWA domain-containing protein n=1 Tax=Thermonema rossianum TaxID=55505 RepID=UPI00068F321A|nr:VWA domain-containing protein [Thermonema rossianum]